MRFTTAVRCAICLSAGVAGAASRSPAQAAPPEQEPRPLAVLVRNDVWYPAIDRPLFILYDDGRVIYPLRRDREYGVPINYQTARIGGSTNPERLLNALWIRPDFFQLRPWYNLRPYATDQSTVTLLVRHGDSVVTVSVRGGEAGPDRLSSSAPEPFRRVFDRLVHFSAPDPEPWDPSRIEVVFWGFEHSLDPSLDWPRGWPGPGSPAAVRVGDALVGEKWIVSLPYGRAPRLNALLKAQRETQAILIDGRKWSVRYRWIFPDENWWRSGFGRVPCGCPHTEPQRRGEGPPSPLRASASLRETAVSVQGSSSDGRTSPSAARSRRSAPSSSA